MSTIPVRRLIRCYGGPNDGGDVPYQGPTPPLLYRHEHIMADHDLSLDEAVKTDNTQARVFRYRVQAFSWGQCYIPDGDPFERAWEN